MTTEDKIKMQDAVIADMRATQEDNDRFYKRYIRPMMISGLALGGLFVVFIIWLTLTGRA